MLLLTIVSVVLRGGSSGDLEAFFHFEAGAHSRLVLWPCARSSDSLPCVDVLECMNELLH